MKASRNTLVDNLSQLGATLLGDSAVDYSHDESPLRAELFSSEQMEHHGRALARSHRVVLGKTPNDLLARLAENEAVLIGACQLLTTSVEENRRIAPAGEWLLDNFHLIEDQVRTARRHLPKEYSRELPQLVTGPSAGLPRVYDLARETVAHGDGRVDPENLNRFVAAYQTISALTLGELWAIPIMLRLALIENLRRVASRIAAARLDRNLADDWADRMMVTAETDPTNLILVIADMARSNPPMSSPFVAEMARRLQGRSPSLALPLSWIEQRLSASSLTIEQLVQVETQKQASDQVSISNSIGSLRFLGATDWRDFVESMSVVEPILRDDPAGVYSWMEFATRDRYRHAVERISKRGKLSEAKVAEEAVRLAAEATATGNGDMRAAHVGHYLIGPGLLQLERIAGTRLTTLESVRRLTCRRSLPLYLGTIGLMTVIGTGLALAVAWAGGGGLTGWALGLLGLLSALAASQIAVTIANWVVTVVVPPDPLPRLDFATGIPPACRTLVAVPTFLLSPDNIDELADALEVRFLANRDEHTHFCLLTDFRDARTEHQDDDQQLLEQARGRIEELNAKYPNATGDSFYLLHRPRRWNPRERLWMGYERKRGKLADLNRLLRTGSTEAFSTVVGDPIVLTNVKYVIPSTPTPCCLETPPGSWSAPWPILSTGLGTTRRSDGWSRDTGFSSRGWASACPRPTAPGTLGSSEPSRASTPILARCPMSIRTCSERGPSSARGSTTSTRSNERSPTVSPRIGS